MQKQNEQQRVEPGRECNQSIQIRWMLGTFKPFKSERTDETARALLQQGMEHVVPYLCCIFTACQAYGCVPMACRHVRVTYVPKPERSDHNEAKAYRRISL
jgi:hypothetical protein